MKAAIAARTATRTATSTTTRAITRAATIAVLLAAVPLVGCGTVTRGTSEDVVINVTPDFADVSTTNGKRCTGSCTINVPRKEAFQVTASAPGYRSETVDVTTRVAGAGAAAMAGNVLVGGVIGMSVDAATGASLEHTPNPVNIDLERAPTS